MARPRFAFLLPAWLPIWALAASAAIAATPPAPVAKPTMAGAGAGEHKKDDEPVRAPGEAEARKEGAAGKEEPAGKKDEPQGKQAPRQKDEAATATPVAAAGAGKKNETAPAAATTTAGARKKPQAPESARGEAGAGSRRAEGMGIADKEEPAGPTTPPIKLGSLRDEMSRPPRKDERSTSHPDREKLEQLAVEINKAREALRQDTARLEATLAARDAAQSPASSGGAGDGAADTGSGKKVPSPLDNLAKAMRGMKPEQAAPIISRVDRKLAADVLLRMPATDAGKVLGVCKPEVAAELAAEIASRTPHAELRR